MKRTHAGLLALGAIASLAANGIARGQDLPGYGPAQGYGGSARGYTDPDAIQDTTRHVTIDVIGDLIYDSNVARGDAAVAAAHGITPADEIFTPTVAIDAYEPIGREAIFLHGNAGYDFYRRNSVLDRERIDLHGGGLGRFGPCRETVTGDFNRQQSDLDELNLEVTKNTTDTENVGFNAVCGRQVGLAPFFGVFEQWHDNSARLLGPDDNRTFGVNWGLGYARPALGTVQLFGTYQTTIFPNSDLAPSGPPIHSGFDLYAGGASFDRRLGARIQGVVSISYTTLAFDSAGPASPGLAPAKGFSGLTYSADVTYRASSRLGARLRYARSTTPSDEIGASYTLDNLLLGDITYKLGPRLILTTGGSRDSKALEGPPTIIGPIIESTRDVEYTGFGTATYQLGRRLAFSLDVRRIQRDASVVQFSYGDTRVDLTATTTF